MSGRTDGKVVISTEAMKDGGRITGVLLRVADNGTGSRPPFFTSPSSRTSQRSDRYRSRTADGEEIVDEHKADIKIANRTDQEGRVCGALVTIAFRVSQDS